MTAACRDAPADSPSPVASPCDSCEPPSVATFRRMMRVPQKVRLDGVLRELPPLKHGEHICYQDDLERDVHFVLDGVLKAYHISPTGEEQIVRFYYSGDLACTGGEGGGRRGMSLISVGTSRVCSMPLASLRLLMSEHLAVQFRFYEILSQQVSEEQELIGVLRRSDAERRVAFLLWQMCNRLPVRHSQRYDLRLPMTRNDLAAYVGLRMETVVRAIRQLEQRGAIVAKGRDITLVDRPKLERIAAGTEESRNRRP